MVGSGISITEFLDSLPESSLITEFTKCIQKEQLTSGGKSTISNWYAISGKMPIAKARMAPAEPTILYRRALFSVRLSMYGWPCKRSKSKPYYLTIKQLFLAVD
jgi:hypothetical protein